MEETNENPGALIGIIVAMGVVTITVCVLMMIISAYAMSVATGGAGGQLDIFSSESHNADQPPQPESHYSLYIVS